MTWLNNPPASGDSEEPPARPSVQSDSSTKQLSLHALRALGIFFIHGAVASLVGVGIAGIGYLILIAGAARADGGTAIVGGVVIGIGALVGFIWQIRVVVTAVAELRKSGVTSW